MSPHRCPWMRGCLSPREPCGSPPIPLAWRDIEDGGIPGLSTFGCMCFFPREAFCLRAADPHRQGAI